MSVAQVSLRERSIRYVKGVGPHRLTQLAQLGIQTIEDACYYAPRRYEDRTHLVAIRDARPGELVTVRGRILAKSLRRIRRGRTIVEAAVGDATGVLYGLWFNQPYLAQQLTVGEECILYGQVEARPRLQVIHPEMERIEGDDDHSIHMGRIVPIYPMTAGIGQRWLRQVIASVLARHSDELEECLPDALRQSKGWPSIAEAVRELHFPSSWGLLEAARQRLAFEELFMLQLALAHRRAKTVRTQKPQRYHLDGPLTQALRMQLPFALTASQQRVLEDLSGGLAHPHPMHRLLHGDVGCGKTIVMVFLIAAAVQSGHQVALMAPTELLAEQHARVVQTLLGPLGVSVGLLSQGVGPSQGAQIIRAIASGTLSVVIGTHALIERGVTFPRLALVMIDEQHKFGVAQRSRLANKAIAPDVLVVTATPIPRTLALSVYGDLDVSTITELPPSRRPVTTRWMREPQREAVYGMIRQQLAAGRQGYVVYPLVEERSTTTLKAATHMARHLQTAVFPEFRVGLLHGQMKPRVKERTMAAFARGELHLLVSTVIVEVGLDIPNATVMVVEHPERFGLAQLHQLRGRIGRGEHPATCLLLSDAADPTVTQRLNAFVQTSDGFELAEHDLEQRGPGELLGREQHGWLRFRIANLLRDRGLLEPAREEARALISRDPDLRDPSRSALRQRLAQWRKPPR
ncbi:MAG: ATP-dependent DNA helicase RecG [Candidatus Omnitrophica bacterium]|nr:ATP-dependent DNA helicase RecG [Candidatus Omnitrophota bacterium]